MTDPTPYMRALRASHDRLAGIAVSLDSDGLRKRSYATEWSIADVLSHLGSGAEIFELYVNAGLGGEPPAQEDNQRIWTRGTPGHQKSRRRRASPPTRRWSPASSR